MKIRYHILGLLVIGTVLSSCTTSQYVASTEYDDIYYSSKDRVTINEPEADVEQEYFEEDNYEYDRYRYDNPSEFYDEDDFYYSRRLRRFNQNTGNSWRYYDPFFANDLYFVMGTGAWNRWNNFGWWDWNRPRFGGGWSVGFINDPWSRWNYGFNGFNRWNNWGWNSFNYFNPYVNAYYGFGPSFGYGFNRFNDPFWGGFYGPSFYGYCPPTNFVNNRSLYQDFTNTQRYVTRHRSSRSNAVSPTELQSRNRTGRQTSVDNNISGVNGNRTSNRTARTSNYNRYLRPQTQAERNVNLPDDYLTRRPARNVDSRGRSNQPGLDNRRNSNNSSVRRDRSNVSRNGREVNRSTNRNSSPSTRRSNSNIRRQSSPSRNSRPSYQRQSSPSRSSSPSRVSPSRSRSSSPSRSSSRSSSSRSSSRSSRNN